MSQIPTELWLHRGRRYWHVFLGTIFNVKVGDIEGNYLKLFYWEARKNERGISTVAVWAHSSLMGKSYDENRVDNDPDET